MFQFLVFLAAVVVVKAIEPYGNHGGHHEDYYTEPHYSFVYEVNDLHTHDIKSHKEERKGDHTQGVYYLVEPDGSKRTVEYVVQGKSGFNAVVHREHSKHPIAGHVGYSGGYGGSVPGGYGGGSLGGYGGGALSGYGGGALGGYGGGALGGYGGGALGGYGGGGYSGNYGAGYGSHGGASSYSSFASKDSLGAAGYRGSAGFGNLHQSGGAMYTGYNSLGSLNDLGGYKGQLVYSGGASRGGYGGGASYGGYGGDATSSVKFSTHGAQIAATTHHIVPVKHHY